MEHKNYERELKYLIAGNDTLAFTEILRFLKNNCYMIIETRLKKKHEIYYDNDELTFIKRGDILRSSNHISERGEYFHFMFKKNVSDPNKPYVSKYEYGSGKFKTIQEFTNELEIDDNIQLNPVLYAEITRETAIVEKGLNRLLISYDTARYHKNTNATSLYEKMLEIEDWTNPNTILNVNSEYDEHLYEINKMILSNVGLPLRLTKDSKPLRGYKLFCKDDDN